VQASRSATPRFTSGAIFLGFAVVILLSLFSTQRLLAGLAFVAIIFGLPTGTQVLGVLVDGAASETRLKLVPELLLLLIFIVGLVIELVRRRRHHEAPT